MAVLDLEDRAFLKLLDCGFEAMAVRECHRRVTAVSRDKKREPLSFGAPLDLDESD